MSLIIDGGITPPRKVDIKPVETKPEIQPQTVVPETNSRQYENNFQGNLLKANVLAKFDIGRSNPTQVANLIFDPNDQISVADSQAVIVQYDKNMSGKDAAKAILTEEKYYNNGVTPLDLQPKFYLDALKNHKSDPKWMAEFYKSLGPEKTAKLIDDTLTTHTFQYSKPDEVRANLANIRQSISILANSNPPLFGQKDMDALVRGFIKDSNNQGIYDLVAVEIFGKMDYKSEFIKTMFFKSASQIALSGQLNTQQSQNLAAAAAHVLSQTSSNNQAEQLSALRGQTPAGSPSNLSKFITLAMHGPSQTPSLEKRLGTLSQYPGDHGPATPEPYGNVDKLIFDAAYAGITDGHTPGPRISAVDVKALQTELFQAATTNLTDGGIESKYNNNFMKDGLSEIFMDNFKDIYKSGLGPNGAGFNSTMKNSMAEFFKFTVFTSSPGYDQKPLMNFIKTQIQDVSQALNDNSPDAEKKFQEKFGLTRNDGAAELGNLLGMMKLGLNAHISEVNDSAEAKKEALGFLFDCTIGLIPGAGGKLSEGSKNIAYKLLGQIVDKSQDRIMDSLKEGALDKAKEYFLEANSDKDPQALLENLKDSVDATLPDGDNGFATYHQTFQSAYNYITNGN